MEPVNAPVPTTLPARGQSYSVSTRPILRYHGGKWRLAPWILQHLPEHRVYIEPFAGAASVLLRKAPASLEVLSDLNGRLVNVFEVLRDPARAAALIEGLRLTPYAEREYRVCRQPAEDPVEDARRLLVLGHQGHGSTAATEGKRSGWRRGDRGTQANSAREVIRKPDPQQPLDRQWSGASDP